MLFSDCRAYLLLGCKVLCSRLNLIVDTSLMGLRFNREDADVLEVARLPLFLSSFNSLPAISSSSCPAIYEGMSKIALEDLLQRDTTVTYIL